MKARLVLLLTLPLLLGGCDRLFAWAKVSESGLGGGYFFVSEGGEQTFIIKSTTQEYEGKGVIVVPPEVLKLDDNSNHIIASTAHCATVEEFSARGAAFLAGEKKCYWIIPKDGGEIRGPLTESEYERSRSELEVSDRLTL